VGCYNGGSDAASFVVVFGFPPGEELPELLLSIDCGVTSWQAHGDVLVIKSGPLVGGLLDRAKPHPDVSFIWQGAFKPTSRWSNGPLGWPPFCRALSPVPVGP